MVKRLMWIVVGTAVGLAAGGIAYATVINPPASSERYYACVANTGVVRYSTLRLNAPPTSCPSASDEIHSWNALGEIGPTGVTGVTGPVGATGEPAPSASIVRIDIPGTPYAISGGTRHDFGAVDTSMCRSLSVGYRLSVDMVSAVIDGGLSIYDPEDTSTIIGRRLLNMRTTNAGGHLYEDTNAVGMADRGALSTRMSANLYANPSFGTVTVQRVWFDCVRFGPTTN